MVAAGLGFAFMPENAAKHPGIVALPVVDPEFWRTVNLVTVRGRRYSPGVGALAGGHAPRKGWQRRKCSAGGAAKSRPARRSLASHCRKHLGNGHSLAIIGIEEPRSDKAVAADHKGRGDRKHPGAVALKGGNIHPILEHSLQLRTHPDR